jgi:hypothetical protein
MSTSTSITTSYSGEFKNKYIAAAVLSAPSLDNVTIHPNVSYKEVIKTLSIDDIVKDGTCDFDPEGTVILKEVILEPKELQVNLKLCKKTFAKDWEAAQMGFGNNKALPPTFADFMVEHVIAKVAEKNEKSLWTGAKDNNGEFDGYLTLLAADASLPADQEVASTSVTPANVVAELGKIVDKLPARLFGRSDLKLYVSPNMYRAYVRSLGGFGASGLGANGFDNKGNNQQFGDVFFDSIPVVIAQGMTDNKAVLTYQENLHFGTGLLADFTDVAIIDQAMIDGSQNVNVVIRFSAGAAVGFASDVVTYGVTNAANNA